MKYNDFIKNPICPKCNNLVNKNKRIYFNKLTYEQVKQEIEIDGYKLISKQYVKSSDKLQIQCPLGHIFNMSHHSFKSGTRCPKCYQLNCTPSNKKTMEQLKKDIFELVGNEYEILSKKYLGNKTKILMKHNSNKCNYNEFEVIPSNFLQGTRCPKCGKLVKKDYDEVKQIVENLGFKYVDKDYKGVEYKFTIKDIYGYYYITSLVVLNMGSIPIKVSTNNPYSIQNIKLWLENTNKEFELLEDIYSKPNQKLKWKCLRNGCGEIFIKNWTGILNGIGCPYCNGKLVGKNNNLLKINPEICKEWNYEKNDKLPSEYMPKSNKKVWWKCNECNHEWQTTISHRSDSRGCPRCNISKGEKKVKYFLEDNKSVYEPQYEFINLLSDLGNPLRFDFAIFKDKEKTQLKMLIEYDGEGHYSAKPFGKKSYKSTIYHDKRKNKYCKLNNIPLLRIPYWDFDNIEQILEKVILC